MYSIFKPHICYIIPLGYKKIDSDLPEDSWITAQEWIISLQVSLCTITLPIDFDAYYDRCVSRKPTSTKKLVWSWNLDLISMSRFTGNANVKQPSLVNCKMKGLTLWPEIKYIRSLILGPHKKEEAKHRKCSYNWTYNIMRTNLTMTTSWLKIYKTTGPDEIHNGVFIKSRPQTKYQ